MANESKVLNQISRIARRNVMRNWRQSIATILAVTAGFTAVSLFDGFMASLDDVVIQRTRHVVMLGDFMILGPGANSAGQRDQWGHALNTDQQKFLADFLSKDVDVAHFSRSLLVNGVISSGSKTSMFIAIAYDLEKGGAMRGDWWYWNTIAGVPLEQAKEPSVVLAKGLGRSLGCEPTKKGVAPDFFRPDGSMVPENRPFKCDAEKVSLTVSTEAGQANVASFPVAGISDAMSRETGKYQMFMDLASAQQIADTDKVQSIKVLLRDRSKIDDVLQRLKAAEASTPYHFDVVRTLDHPMFESIVKGLQMQRTIRNIFLAVVLFVVVMAVANTMMKAVKERTREIGTLRSLGFLRRHIIAMFSLEGMYLSLFACIAGLGATWAGRHLIRMADIKFDAGTLDTPLSVSVLNLPVTWAATAAALILLATFTATISSRKVAHMVVADAMRNT